MENNLKKQINHAIYKTLTYSSLFNYPLASKEIWQYLIWEEKEKPPSHKDFRETLKNLHLQKFHSYYYLSDKTHVELRESKQKSSSQKKQLAQIACLLLQKIPTIKLIGISGALSMDNANKNDDIDLFIICQKNTLWLTRFLATFLLDLKNLRRKPYDKKFKDKICLNMFLEENYLTLPTAKQNLYTAHEVIQLKPIYDKEDTYQKFLTANSWVSNYLPNATSLITNQKVGAGYDARPQKSVSVNRLFGYSVNRLLAMQPFSHLLSIIHDSLFMILDNLVRIPQLLYMRPRRTKEIVNSHVLFFHPHDISKKILKKYNSRNRSGFVKNNVIARSHVQFT